MEIHSPSNRPPDVAQAPVTIPGRAAIIAAETMASPLVPVQDDICRNPATFSAARAYEAIKKSAPEMPERAVNLLV